MIRFLSVLFVLLFAVVPAFGQAPPPGGGGGPPIYTDPSVEIYYTLMGQTSTHVTYVANFTYDQGDEPCFFLELACTGNDTFTTYNQWYENGVGGFEMTMNKTDCLGQEFTISVTMRDLLYDIIAYDSHDDQLPTLGNCCIYSFSTPGLSGDVFAFKAEVMMPYGCINTISAVVTRNGGPDNGVFNYSHSDEEQTWDYHEMYFEKTILPIYHSFVTLTVTVWDGPFYLELEPAYELIHNE